MDVRAVENGCTTPDFQEREDRSVVERGSIRRASVELLKLFVCRRTACCTHGTLLQPRGGALPVRFRLEI